MEDITVNLDDDILEILGEMAAASGLTIEEECRRILHEWAAKKNSGIFGTRSPKDVPPRRRKALITLT